MVQPIDLHVLLNRALELQRIQGVALRQPQEENEIFKNRIDQEIAEEERQVRRKREKVYGRVQEEKGRQRERKEQDRKKRQQRALARAHAASTPSARSKKNGKGQIIDLEV